MPTHGGLETLLPSAAISSCRPSGQSDSAAHPHLNLTHYPCIQRFDNSLTCCKTSTTVQLPNSERVILQLLVGKGPCYGLELVDSSRGALKRGGVYVTLGRMEEKGLVKSAAGESGRRLYKPTALGERALAAAKVFSGHLRLGAKA